MDGFRARETTIHEWFQEELECENRDTEGKTPERRNSGISISITSSSISRGSGSHLEVGIDGTGPVPVLLQGTPGAQVVRLRATGTGQRLSGLWAVACAASTACACAANKQRRSRQDERAGLVDLWGL